MLVIKKVIGAFFLIIFFFLFPRDVYSQVVINEFSSFDSSNDWVEIYSSQDVDISGWILRDSASSKVSTIPEDTSIGPSSSYFYIIDAKNRLNKGFNKDGDKIRILKSDDTTEVDSIIYGDIEGSAICAPSNSNQSIGRIKDGGGVFVRFAISTKASPNTTSEAPCPTLTPSPSPTPVPTQKPTLTPKPTTTPKPTLVPTLTPSPTPYVISAYDASSEDIVLASSSIEYEDLDEIASSSEMVLGVYEQEKKEDGENSDFEEKEKWELDVLPLVSVGIGAILVAVSLLPFIKLAIGKYNKKYAKNEEDN